MAITNQTKTIVGVFNSVQDANAAVRDLEAQGISRDQISVVANKNASGFETMEDRDKTSDVVADAGIGAAIGGVGGLLLSAAGALTIPGVGPNSGGRSHRGGVDRGRYRSSGWRPDWRSYGIRHPGRSGEILRRRCSQGRCPGHDQG